MRSATAALAATLLASAAGAQPFQGTAFMSPRILTAADPSVLRSVEYAGRGDRVIWDYRVMDWITVDAYLFNARIGARDVEFQVNSEFGSEAAARVEVDAYAADIGRLPAVLLSNLAKVHVNAGRPAHPEAATFQPRRVFGGNRFDQSITIHTGTGEEYRQDGFLEEVLFHEGAHVSVDGAVVNDPAWHAAQGADGEFISDYARDNPDREDVAESILPYFAARFRPDRLRPGQRQAIEDVIPARLEYFDAQGFDWSPVVSPANRPPEPVGALPPLTLGVDGPAVAVEVGGAFRDPDGDRLTYGAASSAPTVAAVAVLGSTVTVTPTEEGTATVTVTATDAGGSNGTATQTFTATVGLSGARRFTDDPIVPGVTSVRAVHFTELRVRIDVLRREAGLAPFGWTDAVLRPGVTPVRGVHLIELRSALAEAYASSGRSAPRWTDASPAAGSTPIRAAHVTELRAAVLALE